VKKIGFMQGRLSPIIGGRIQSFPWECWQQEFALGQVHDFHLIEWTLDQDRLYENPLLTRNGQDEIKSLCFQHDFEIPSLTGDCFMQAPFWKEKGDKQNELHQDFIAVAEACGAVGISLIVVPLVDSGRIENESQEDELVTFFESQKGLLNKHGLRIVFESDFKPNQLARFIERFDPKLFGINYDIGNSASLGFNPLDEISDYGDRILNVHIKDRLLGGSTVPLGLGNADFKVVFDSLRRMDYSGNYILQTARAVDGDHARALCEYREMTIEWLFKYAI
jgi:L-ribulose-5-phosphate 3-epimerase